jgi:hypothetical protein
VSVSASMTGDVEEDAAYRIEYENGILRVKTAETSEGKKLNIETSENNMFSVLLRDLLQLKQLFGYDANSVIITVLRLAPLRHPLRIKLLIQDIPPKSGFLTFLCSSARYV